MVQTQIVSYGSTAYEQVLKLREEILRKPLGLQLTKQDIAQDANEIIIGAFDAQGRVVGCVQLRIISKKQLKLRQMAVLPQLQGQGIGRRLVVFAEDIALQKQFEKIALNARETALGFYQKLGYTVHSKPFLEVGILHYKMCKLLI